MAISKILYIGDCGAGYRGKHLNQAINYIMDKDKTGDGRWVSTINCQEDSIYEQMRATKEHFGKTGQRQGYHMIISFAEGEVDADTAFEVIGKFTKEYLGKDYEAVYTVHDNTDNIHGHIIFNSVSFRTGMKYRYKKGDWAKHIQPITNRLCEEYGLSTIETSDDRAKKSAKYSEWDDFRDGKFVWSDMIKRDLDACIMQAATYDSFLVMLTDMGYEVKQGKHLAIKPMGMKKFRRCKSLGQGYAEDNIRERIMKESISDYIAASRNRSPRIAWSRIRRYPKANLSGLQKKHFAKLYRTGQLKKRPYSQAYMYRDDIRRMKQLQEEYLLLSKYNVSKVSELMDLSEDIQSRKKRVSKEKSKVFKERARFKPLFTVAEEIEYLKDFESGYINGETLFEDEHGQYMELCRQLDKDGYTINKLQGLKDHYRNEINLIKDKEKRIRKEERAMKRIVSDLGSGQNILKEEKDLVKTKGQTGRMQP